MDDNERLLAMWHDAVLNRNLDALSDILAEDVQFFSPFVWKPRLGHAEAYLVLSTVVDVFQDFTYHRELTVGKVWTLEFSARVGELGLKGMDLIEFNDAGKIKTFEVFIRPANALQALGMEMLQRLSEK